MVQNYCLKNGQQIPAMEEHLLIITGLLVSTASKILDHFQLVDKIAAVKRTLLEYMPRLLSHSSLVLLAPIHPQSYF